MNVRRILCKRLLVVMCVLFSGAAVAAADRLPVLKITVDGSITKDMEYAKGTMSLTDENGAQIDLKAKFRIRGATSTQYLVKPSLNMKLRTDDYSKSQDSLLLGLRSASKWILDAMAIDRICMRNRLCMDVWNEMSPLPYATDFGGRSGTVGRFIELYINGEYKGIYCLSDFVNRKLLQLKKYDEKKGVVCGVLYKSGTSDIANQNERNFTLDWTAGTISWHNAWELKEPDGYECEAAWQPLIDLFDNRNSYSDVRKYFYLSNLVDYQLHVMALCIQDNWGNKNHFFSIRNIQKNIDDTDPTEAARRKCVVSPWDLDTSLGGSYDGSKYDGNYSSWDPKDVVKNGGFYPFSVCQGQAEYNALLKARWKELRTTALSKESINRRLENYRDLFLNTGAWSRMVEYWNKQKIKPCYVEDLAKEIALVEKWYSERFDMMDAYFGVETGISSVEAEEKKDDAIYSVEGVRLNSVPAKGLYIRGGKLRMN